MKTVKCTPRTWNIHGGAWSLPVWEANSCNNTWPNIYSLICFTNSSCKWQCSTPHNLVQVTLVQDSSDEEGLIDDHDNVYQVLSCFVPSVWTCFIHSYETPVLLFNFYQRVGWMGYFESPAEFLVSSSRGVVSPSEEGVSRASNSAAIGPEELLTRWVMALYWWHQ